MRSRKIVFSVIFLFACCSCATQTLWKNTNPDEYVMIKFTEITEADLKKKGAKYIRDDSRHAFYVEKGAFQRFTDYSVRALGTPVTVTIDATVIVLFAVASAIVNQELNVNGISVQIGGASSQ